MWRAESTPGPIYPMTQKIWEAWKRWDSCFSHVTLPLSPSPENISHPLALGLYTYKLVLQDSSDKAAEAKIP